MHSTDPAVPEESFLVKVKVHSLLGSDVATTSTVPSPKFQIWPEVPSADWVLIWMTAPLPSACAK